MVTPSHLTVVVTDCIIRRYGVSSSFVYLLRALVYIYLSLLFVFAVLLPMQFWVFSLLGMALIEYNTITKAFAPPSAVTGEAGLKEDYSPGDLGFDPLGIKPKDEEGLMVMQTKELNNGRLAMIGIAGMLVQELVKPEEILSFLG